MPEKNKAVASSVTFSEKDRDWLVHFAEAHGQMRTHPWTGQRAGNLSWAVNEAHRFLRSHLDLYLSERSQHLTEELEEVGDG